jgi:arylsulfatase A-like enzyme
VPEIPEAPSQSDSLDDRPACQAQFRDLWPQLLYPQAADDDYRRLYHYLLALVDESVARILAALDEHGFTDDTIVVFTSDHGDLLGAHGGLQQKWHNAYDEAIHVPLIVAGPGIDPTGAPIDGPTSHVDLVPTLLGLIGSDPDDLVDEVAAQHTETHPLPGRNLSDVLYGRAEPTTVDEPVYFMTEDEISRGARQENAFTHEPFAAVEPPACVESVIAVLDGVLWKLNRYYDADGRAGEEWELHDLTGDPEERVNRYGQTDAPSDELADLLDRARRGKRLTPRHTVNMSSR